MNALCDTSFRTSYIMVDCEYMILIVGLGNTGEKYVGTRHNAGRDAVIYFGNHHSFPDFVKNSAYRACVSRGIRGDKEILLLNPETFMNASGTSVVKVWAQEKPETIIIVYDDADLPLGTVRISFNRSSGGHNGVESVIKELGNREFARVRIGISPVLENGEMHKPKAGDDFDRFVLGVWREREKEQFGKILETVRDVLDTIIDEGVTRAMDMYN